jgi:hypothetical protein
MLLAEDLVHPAQESDGLEVLATAMHVRQPLSFLAAIVAVEHRGDGIDPQAVDAVALDPEEGIADQVVADFAAAEVVDQRTPVLVHALARVGVLVEGRAVEAAEAVFVGREMRWHPVDQHAQAGGVAGGDEFAKAGRVAMTGGGRVKAERLIAPGSVEGVLRNRQQLEMREAQVDEVRDQRFADPLPVGKPPSSARRQEARCTS